MSQLPKVHPRTIFQPTLSGGGGTSQQGQTNASGQTQATGQSLTNRQSEKSG